MNDIVEQQNRKPALSMGGTVSAIVPQDINQAFRLADAIHQGGMSPYGMETPQKIMIAMLAGMEVGLPPMAAVQSVAVINNRPCMWGDALIGVVRSSNVCEYVREWIDGEGDEMIAYCETKRKSETEPVKRSFSVDDAKRAGLWQTEARVQKRARGGGTYEAANDSPWYKYPKRMLGMRARAWCLRDTYADILKGMQVREEVEDYPERHRGPDNARDITPTIADRLQAASSGPQQSGDAQEGFSAGFALEQTESLSVDSVNVETGEIETVEVEAKDEPPESEPTDDQAETKDSEPDEPQGINKDLLKEVFRRLYASVGEDPQVVVDTANGMRDQIMGENEITRKKANTIKTQCKLLCLGDVSDYDMIEYLAGVIGVEPQDLDTSGRVGAGQ
ncbi:hypothetical protein [Pseudohoeflea coraliihabitans]|uniref:RecT family protein n=1 Tax=Pseudohoeflea coraliihabitans TaxID=2860393 RepID=A0ABS6WLN5_9HYPH|nr:hypothetical protein [Pseudohoeflea sp. DP4N28-3]MBW3096853.1 hypothetical protein [Pseudohoeflea sp. DP4N28-3]